MVRLVRFVCLVLNMCCRVPVLMLLCWVILKFNLTLTIGMALLICMLSASVFPTRICYGALGN